MAFQRIVLTIAIVCLIFWLTIIGILLYYQQAQAEWPPEISQCPDYWDVAPDGSCKVNAALGNAGNGSCVSYTPPASNSQSARCTRQKWARGCGIYWDGITDLTADVCKD